MAKSRKPTINLKCPAAAYAAPQERIAEFSTAKGVGGLIQIRETTDGRCAVQIYRCDPGVFVSSDAQQRPIDAAAPAMLTALQMALPALERCEKQWEKSPQHGEGLNVLAFVRSAIANASGTEA